MVSTRSGNKKNLVKTKENRTSKHPYNTIKDNKFKDKMNELIAYGVSACLDSKPTKILVLDGDQMRTTKTLINKFKCKKEIFTSIEFNEKTHNIHKKFGINSIFTNLENFIKQYEGTPFDLFCCDSLGNIQTSGNYILNSVNKGIISNGTLVLITFSKRGNLYGENFTEERFKFYRKLELSLEPKNLYLMSIPNLENPFIEYAARNQSAMYSEIFYIGTDKANKRVINYPILKDIPKKIISHKGTMSKRNKLKFLTKWEGSTIITEEPWFNLKNCGVFHNYLRLNKMHKLIPDLYK
jgi:hypothetical protein